MDTLRAAESPECNQGIYEALLVSYDTFAAEQPFYRLWDSGAVMYYLDPEVSTRAAFRVPSTRVVLHAIDAT